MILKNKRTQERIQLSYIEFQNRFAKEIQVALESYLRIENNPILDQTKILKLASTLIYSGISTILEIQIGILKNYKVISHTKRIL